MAYNHGLEEKKFQKEWKKLKAEYVENGMSKEQIDAIYEFDRDVFNSDRRYLENHEDFALEESYDAENENVEAKHAKTYERNREVLSTEFDVFTEDYFNWDELIDGRLLKLVKTLSEEEQELLKLFAIDEMSIVEIAKVKNVAHQTISKKIKRIKLKMKRD